MLTLLMLMKAHTYGNDRVYRQLLIYIMTVITTTSILTPCSHSPVEKRLVWNGMVWLGMRECEVLFRCSRRVSYDRDLAF